MLKHFRSHPKSYVYATVAFAYFLVYPHDIENLLSPLSRIVDVLSAIPTGLYALLIGSGCCFTAYRIWGVRTGQP